MKIGIVTDSTADMPAEFYRQHDVRMVPLVVRFGDDVYKDWIDLEPDGFYKRMKASDILPKTSQPSVGDFTKTYEELIAEGCGQIISIHISSKLSGTIQSAQAACRIIQGAQVRLIDSELTAVILGRIVEELAKARDQGVSFDDLVHMAERYRNSGRILFVVDTLKYLELGGRIGKAQALLGSLLSVKPILHLERGLVAPRAKVKGAKRAKRELVSLVKEEIKARRDKSEVKVMIAYTDNPEIVDELKALMEEAAIDLEDLRVGQIGSVIGTYVGPGTYAIGLI